MAPRLKFLPDALSKTLLEFQQEGVLFGISKNGRCLIGDEMGLGKTLQALSIAYYYKNEWPLLIVCPSSMRFPWIEEIEKWLPDIQPGELNLIQSGTDASNIPTSKISIVGYGLLSHPSSRLLINCLKDTKFGIVVVDESHYMKNRKAARTKALVSVIKNTKRAVLLTGTPALARPEELYVQIDVLKPNLLGTFGNYAERFCEAHMEYVCGGRIRKWNTQGASNLDELHNILKTNVMIRRLKRNVLKQLPPKRRQRIAFDLADSEHKKHLTDVIKEFRSVQRQIHHPRSSQSALSGDKNPVFEMKRLATVLYKETGLSKISTVRQYIAEMLDNSDKKFLVFAHHLDVMKAIELEVMKKRVKYIRIAGDVPSILRGSLVQQFQNDSSVRVAILSMLAASVGITLTAADHIIFSELHWTPGVMQQAEDRVHRIGQEKSVLVQYLVAKGTIDEFLWRMLCSKVYVTTAALNGKLQGLDVEEGSEGQSKLLEAFSAWVMDDDEEEAAEEDFLFTHSQKKRKQDVHQRSLTEFFHSPSASKCRKTDSGKEWTELPDSSSEESEVSEIIPLAVEKCSTPVVQEHVIEEVDDEESSLRKTTRKTYKITKKTHKTSPSANESTIAGNKATVGKDLMNDSLRFGSVNELNLECEFAQNTGKIEGEERDSPEKDVLGLLSSYTSLLDKPTNEAENIDLIQDEAEKEVDHFPESSELDKASENQVENVDLTRGNDEEKEVNHFPESPELDEASEEKEQQQHEEMDHFSDGSELHEADKNLADTNSGRGDKRPTAPEFCTLGDDEDLGDFKAGGSWCCSLCTFTNNGFLRVCEMCETPRHSSRRTLTSTRALSTPEFVKRKQEKILHRCLSSEKKTKSRGKKKKEGEVCGQGSGLDGTVMDTSISEHQASLAGVKTEPYEEHRNLENQDLSPSRTDCESRESPILFEVAADDLPTIDDESETEHMDDVTCVNRSSLAEASDELLASGSEAVKAATEELFLPGDELDELTSEDWWRCETCNKYNYDELAEVCEVCGHAKEKSGEHVEGAVPDLEGDWWRCESCNKYNYDELAEVCEVCGHAKGKPGEHVEGAVPDLEGDWWRCEQCGTFQFDRDVTTCDKCDVIQNGGEEKKSFVVDWEKYGHLMVEDCGGSREEMGTPQTVENLMFCVSCYTDRVYLYNENAEPLNCNVSLLDLEASNAEDLPNILMETSNKKQAMRFMRKWKALPERQRRLVRKTGVVFEDPYEAVELVKTGRVQTSSTCRFPSKEKLREEVMAAATEANGTVRHCTKTKGQRRRGATDVKTTAPSKSSNTSRGVSAPSNSNQRTWIQAVDDIGRPLCISCKSPVDTKNTDCQWDERFCSHKCKEDHQVRLSGTRVRHKLFEEERGVCQICAFDAHAAYKTVKLLPKAERRTHLENTSFITLPVTLLNKIIVDPKEGMFWEADHAVPVVEGGGECGLENYRTLCVPCHRHVTDQLRKRLRTSREKAKVAGIPDITTFFNS